MALFLVVVVLLRGKWLHDIRCDSSQFQPIYKQFNMTVLGRLSMSSFIHAGAVEMTVVVLLCYGIAVKEGHVKAWLPSISACGELPPEVTLALTPITAIYQSSNNT